jgi:tetratricopeptide (TPR) repeat protein
MAITGWAWGLAVLGWWLQAPEPTPDPAGCGEITPAAVAGPLAEAELLRRAGDRGPALEQVALAERAAAGDADAQVKVGALYRALEDVAAAGRAFREARRLAGERARAGGDEVADPAALASAAARAYLGEVDGAGQELDRITRSPDKLARYRCRVVPVVLALAETGAAAEADWLAERLRQAAPDEQQVLDAWVEAAFLAGRPEEAEKRMLAALQARPGDVGLSVRLANRLKTTGRAAQARDLLEELVLQGRQEPALLGELLGMISGRERARDLLPAYEALWSRHPGLPALAMIVGVLRHYLHQYQTSTQALEQAGPLVQAEPRVAMYLAMNHFRTGGQVEAERYIAVASRAGREDPDVFYCRAVIHARRDPAAALADLRRYMAMTTGRPDVNPDKQVRVSSTMQWLEACLGTPDGSRCVTEGFDAHMTEPAFLEGNAPAVGPVPPTPTPLTWAPAARCQCQAAPAWWEPRPEECAP